jgi:hypothetical protein
MDPERDLTQKVVQRKGFFESVLYEDALEDWNLAKEFGEFLIRQDPHLVMGHALVARACRHLGVLERARAELEQCRHRVPPPLERELFRLFLGDEEQKIRITGQGGGKSEER